MRTAVGALDALAPIGLEALVDHAELMTRVDRKYVVGLDELGTLLSGVPVGTRVLEIDGRREFGYRSTYLDTPDRRSFLTSGRSHRHRWKVRGRVYLETGGSWLEVKTAGPRGRTVKQRMVHAVRLEDGLSAEGRAFVTPIVGPEVTCALTPVLVTAYRRTTLLLPRSGARVTIDVDLDWTSMTSGDAIVSRRLAIVETKTGSTPSPVDRQLWARGHRPVRLSKFGVGMAALHPELPRLKWHRALERHLSFPIRSTPRGVTP